jgi:hypothetical protein
LKGYLDLVGAKGGGNGGASSSASDEADAYLDSVGVTRETAHHGATANAGADDDTSAVDDADPFEAGSDTADSDAMDAVQGTPEDASMAEQPLTQEADIDQQHHG